MTTYHSINHLLHEQATQQPDVVVLGFPTEALKYTKYTYKDLDVAASLLAKHYVESGLLTGRARGDNTSSLVVGFLCQNSFDYVVNELALSRIGCCILLISPNNSPAAVLHLLTQTRAQSVIVSESLIHVVESALSLIPHGSELPKIIIQPPPEIYDPVARQMNWNITWRYPLDFELESELPFVIIHSSGSTGHPKPIPISHRAGLENYSQHLGYSSFTTLPLYHEMTIVFDEQNFGHSNMYRAFYCGRPFYIFPSELIPMTAHNIISLLKSTDCDAEAVYAVPLVLTFLAEREEGIEILRKMKAVMYSGSALSDEIGDKLVASGVRLIGQMGSTETGQIGTSVRDFDRDKAWNYIRGPKHSRKFFRFDDQGDGKYELVVLDGYPTKVKSNQPDGSYRTRDLFMMHPTLECAFKFCGRLDDTLVMINGEKTNPVPIELSLAGNSPYISDAIVFGAGRAQVGALILPSERGKDKSRDELLTLITPALKIANADAPSHSQLAPEAIVFLPYGTPIPRADKGSPIRARTYTAFEKIIKDVYRSLEGDLDPGIIKRRILTPEEGKTLVYEIIKETLGDKVDGLEFSTDLFALGLDSLQASRIRNAMQRSLDIGPHRLSSNFVFEHPSVHDIGQYLFDLSSSRSEPLSESSQADFMLSLVQTYRTFASDVLRPAELAPLQGHNCLLLTGATGSLGAHLLKEYLVDDRMDRIYCLVRANSREMAEQRVTQSMATRGLVEEFESRRKKVVYFTVDFEKDRLGLSMDEYMELLNNVTLIIHCAWPVNFNLGISSFVPHIVGAINLMKLALESTRSDPALFYFCSSISAVLARPGPDQIPEEVTDEPAFAQQMGYARSKWVVEKLCQIASNTSPLSARVLRIGQLVGDSRNGIWNESEAIPLMFKGAQVTSTLPILDESMAWLPVDTAARVIHELISFLDEGYEGDSLCWHIVQPKRVPWSEILDHFETSGLKFSRVSRKEWLRSLRDSDADAAHNPTIKLLGFYEKKYGYDDERMLNKHTLATKKTEATSPTLCASPSPDENLVRKWVQNWRKTGFLQ